MELVVETLGGTLELWSNTYFYIEQEDAIIQMTKEELEKLITALIVLRDHEKN